MLDSGLSGHQNDSPMRSNSHLILLIHCRDQAGIVASVTTLIGRFRGNIVDLDQHVDTERGVLFMRVEW